MIDRFSEGKLPRWKPQTIYDPRTNQELEDLEISLPELYNVQLHLRRAMKASERLKGKYKELFFSEIEISEEEFNHVLCRLQEVINECSSSLHNSPEEIPEEE